MILLCLFVWLLFGVAGLLIVLGVEYSKARINEGISFKDFVEREKYLLTFQDVAWIIVFLCTGLISFSLLLFGGIGEMLRIHGQNTIFKKKDEE